MGIFSAILEDDKSVQEEIVVSGSREEWLEKCVTSLSSSNFFDVTTNELIYQIEAHYQKGYVTGGTILITLTPSETYTKIKIISTSFGATMFKDSDEINMEILSNFKKGLR
jgi:hypothetical protein